MVFIMLRIRRFPEAFLKRSYNNKIQLSSLIAKYFSLDIKIVKSYKTTQQFNREKRFSLVIYLVGS